MNDKEKTLNQKLLRWPFKRKPALMDGGLDPRTLQALSVEARRARKQAGMSSELSSSAPVGRELSRGRPVGTPASLLTESPTSPQQHETERSKSPSTTISETAADRQRQALEAHLAAKPVRPPVTVEEIRHAPYATLESLYARLEVPAEGEYPADWSVRRQVCMAAIWRRKQDAAGIVEVEWPRFFVNPPEQYQ
jgi:hypothetical protein